MAAYSEITEPGLQSRVRDRYATPVGTLRQLGFRHLAYSLEALGPYSVILKLPILLLASRREVIVILRPLRLAVANVLLRQDEPPTIALCMGLGVKFYTSFTDRTILISSDFSSDAIPRPGSRIRRLPPAGSLELTWQAHRDQAGRMTTEGSSLAPRISFLDYVDLSEVEEDLTQYA